MNVGIVVLIAGLVAAIGHTALVASVESAKTLALCTMLGVFLGCLVAIAYLDHHKGGG